MQPKNKEFTEDLQALASFAKLLSHPARIAIIQLLAKEKSCISGDIALKLPLSRATVCQHLHELKNAGLIRGEVSGLNVNYCLDVKKWQAMSQQFRDFLDIPISNFPCNC